jgi:hypothetical protein
MRCDRAEWMPTKMGWWTWKSFSTFMLVVSVLVDNQIR